MTANILTTYVIPTTGMGALRLPKIYKLNGVSGRYRRFGVSAALVFLMVFFTFGTEAETSREPDLVAAFEAVLELDELIALVDDLGLASSDFETRSLICHADHFRRGEVNEAMNDIGWPGPFFPDQQIRWPGEETELQWPILEVEESYEAGLPVVEVSFAVGPEGGIHTFDLGTASGVELDDDASSALAEALSQWRFKPPEGAAIDGVCRNHFFIVPEDLGSVVEDDGGFSREAVRAVTSVDELLQLIESTGARRASAAVRSAMCALVGEAHRDYKMDQRLFDAGWPGPFPGKGVVRAKQIRRSSSSQPQYNELARKKRVQGTVQLSWMIGADGVPRFWRALKAQPFGLTGATVRGFDKARYEPAQLKGHAVSSCLGKTSTFRLD